ncbi:RidA family protein [Chitinophaga filiformis]|uniref:Enamine deaminase RidA, house cleaning of reactive enamine intermediates, YjgF/YER057c/UK114 family n=1 Tax=Chitinophaga filiformis TaxID=104663 RepID=A0A1G7S6H9_CHIFI|nr:RidA family protein [Chitinophaga filiformis]SDG18591.1 Enamine deaminase RidA, house cleaning of reactive enamine intermediates, YjgF/YER057c/UK114 family [Chitinophaga filiformis]
MKVLMLFISMLISATVFAQTPEEKLLQLKITLPEVPPAIGSYVDVRRVGNLLYLSGKGPRNANGEYTTGKLGQELSVQQGYDAAKLTAINQLAVLRKELGSLNKVKQIVKVNGYVNCTAAFSDQPKVINGFSDLMIQVFGEPGKHARTALGTNALPMNMAVEVEMIVEVE